MILCLNEIRLPMVYGMVVNGDNNTVCLSNYVPCGRHPDIQDYD